VCFLSQFTDRPCDGRLVKAHLIRRQVLRRLVGPQAEHDDRTWVWSCGGPVGMGGHHGMLDYARTIRIPRERLPGALEEFVAEHPQLAYWLDREYGIRQEDPQGVTSPHDAPGSTGAPAPGAEEDHRV
jgi:hypothetical protein